MKIKLQNGKPASSQAIEEIQAAIGHVLSDSFKNFSQTSSGAKPETNILKSSESCDVGVNAFIPVEEILEERRHIENLPKHAYPVAWAEGGNYIVVDEGRSGAVYFWDHELPEGMVELAPGFNAFLERLEPFDISKVELKPGQVKKAWIDPKFLDRLKSRGD